MPVHAHSLSTSAWLAVPQADVRGALGAVSWAELRQVTVTSGRAALPASWAQLAILTTESVRRALCPWPQLAGEVIAAGISAVIREAAVTLLSGLHQHISADTGHRGQTGQPFKEAAAHPAQEGFLQGLSTAVAEVQAWQEVCGSLHDAALGWGWTWTGAAVPR